MVLPAIAATAVITAAVSWLALPRTRILIKYAAFHEQPLTLYSNCLLQGMPPLLLELAASLRRICSQRWLDKILPSIRCLMLSAIICSKRILKNHWC